jgi:hypothetical protein
VLWLVCVLALFAPVSCLGYSFEGAKAMLLSFELTPLGFWLFREVKRPKEVRARSAF